MLYMPLFLPGTPIEHVHQFVRMVVTPTVPAGTQRFYRGVPKHFRITLPSVFRSERLKNKEKWLFDQLLAANPSDFITDGTTLDKLVRMQHHGLPTRLLDITANPLMALYFACSKDAKDIGEVLSFVIRDDDVKFPDSDRAAILANLARLTSEQRASMVASLRSAPTSGQLHENDAVQTLMHFVMQEKPYFLPRVDPRHLSSIIVVRAKRSNLRIAAQSGAFLLFGDGANFDTARKGQGSVTQTFRILSNGKATILKELDQLGINESTVYPSLERSASYLAEPFKLTPEEISDLL